MRNGFLCHYPQQVVAEDSADKAAEIEADDGSKPRNDIASRWEKYKKEFVAQKVRLAAEYWYIQSS